MRKAAGWRPSRIAITSKRYSEVRLQRSSRRDDARLVVVGFRVGTGTALELPECRIADVVVHTAKAVAVEYVERVESEEEVDPFREEWDSLGSLQVFFLVGEVAYISQRFGGVSKSIVRRLGESGRVELSVRSILVGPEFPKECTGICPGDHVGPCIPSRCLARKGTCGPVVFLHEEREAGGVGIHTA